MLKHHRCVFLYVPTKYRYRRTLDSKNDAGFGENVSLVFLAKHEVCRSWDYQGVGGSGLIVTANTIVFGAIISGGFQV